MPVEQFLQTAQPQRPSDPLLLRLSGESPALENLNEVLPDAFLHKKRLGILRQHTYPPNQLHLPPVRLLESGQQLQAGGLSGAVAAQQGQKLAPPQGEAQTLHHVRQLFFVFEPQTFRRDGRFIRICAARLRRQLHQGVSIRELRQPIPALPHRDRAVSARIRRGCPDPHRGRHGQEH